MTLTDDEKHRLRDMGGACEGWVLRSQHLTPDEVADAADDCISEQLSLMDDIAALKVCGNCKHTVTPLSDMMCGAPIADDESYDWEGGYFPYVSPNDNCHYKPSYWEAYYGYQEMINPKFMVCMFCNAFDNSVKVEGSPDGGVCRARAPYADMYTYSEEYWAAFPRIHDGRKCWCRDWQMYEGLAENA